MRTLRSSTLIVKLSDLRGATPVSLLAAIEPPMRKTDNPYYGEVEQIVRVNGMINWLYEHSVNLQRVREGREPDFEAEPRVWGERQHRTPWVKHKGNFYLEVKVQSLSESWWRWKGTMRIIDDKKVLEFLRERTSESRRQQLDKPVICRDFRLDHILWLTVGGVTYRVSNRRAA